MDGSEYSTVRQSISDENGNRIRAQIRPTLAGNYLSSRFAQRHHDWAQATDFVDGVLKYAPDDLGLTKRAMVLGMGAGQYDLAIEKASDVLKNEPDNALALLFKAMEAYKNKDYKARPL